MGQPRFVFDKEELNKAFLRWITDGQPNITRAGTPHVTLQTFCKTQGVATLESIARELLKL